MKTKCINTSIFYEHERQRLIFVVENKESVRLDPGISNHNYDYWHGTPSANNSQQLIRAIF